MQGPPTCAQFVALGHLDIAIASAITAGGAYYALSDEAPGVEDGMERASVAVGAAIGAGLYAWSAYDGHREKRACRAQVADYAAFVAH